MDVSDGVGGSPRTDIVALEPADDTARRGTGHIRISRTAYCNKLHDHPPRRYGFNTQRLLLSRFYTKHVVRD